MKSFRDDANVIVGESIRAVLPDAAVRRALEDFDRPEGRLILVAAGKAAWQMAKAAVEYLESAEECADDADGLKARPVIDDGIVITKYGHVKGLIPRVRCLEAGHPVPDENGFAATAKALAIADKYGLTLSPEVRELLKKEKARQLDHVKTVVTGSVRELCLAAAESCRKRGYEPVGRGSLFLWQ